MWDRNNMYFVVRNIVRGFLENIVKDLKINMFYDIF